MNKDYIITIDGPVSSGKSTIGKMLAKRRGMVYLDTGAMYRVVEGMRLHEVGSPESDFIILFTLSRLIPNKSG